MSTVRRGVVVDAVAVVAVDAVAELRVAVVDRRYRAVAVAVVVVVVVPWKTEQVAWVELVMVAAATAGVDVVALVVEARAAGLTIMTRRCKRRWRRALVRGQAVVDVDVTTDPVTATLLTYGMILIRRLSTGTGSSDR
jgi:hypothetical protein